MTDICMNEEDMMSKTYRDTKRRAGVQTVHKRRFVHALDDVIPLAQLREEVCG
jgi:hypothetical protein